MRMCVPVSMRLHVYGCTEVILRPAAPTHPPTHAGIGEHPSVMDDFGITGISKGPACNTNPSHPATPSTHCTWWRRHNRKVKVLTNTRTQIAPVSVPQFAIPFLVTQQPGPIPTSHQARCGITATAFPTTSCSTPHEATPAVAKATGRCERCDLTARDNSTSDNDKRKYLVSFCYDDRIHTHVCKEDVPPTRLHVFSSQAL